MVSSHPVFPPLTGCDGLVSETSSRVPVPLPEDPYEAIRQAYLVGTGTEFEPFEDLRTESPESPHVVASPILFPDNAPPVGHVEETARVAVRVQPVLSPGYSARIAEAASMSEVAFHKRFRSSYEGSPSPSPTLPVWKRYRGTSELILGTDSEGDELGDEEVSLDSDSGNEDVEDEGPAGGDEGYGLDDKSRGIDDEGHSVERDGLGLEEEDKAVLEGQQQAAPVVETTMGEPLGLGYRALRRRELAAKEDQRYSTFEVGQGSGSAPEPERSERDHTQRLDVMPPTLFAEIDRDVRELYTRSGAVRDEIFSQRYRLRSLEQEQERAVMTFGALWRPVLALETWAGHVDTRMENMSRAGYDDHRLVHDLLVQQTSLQHELQEMRGRVTALEQERDRGEQ
ncbi:hypothetical protein Tco_0519298 [Tanacetum coccineum]